MKLSEAIRLGAMLRPQGRGSLFSDDGRSCALGAAYEAAGCVRPRGLGYNVNWDLVAAKFVGILFRCADCPVCRRQLAETVNSIVSHLNDDHGWTRERIADWVASQEALTEAKTEDAVRLSTDEPVVSIRA